MDNLGFEIDEFVRSFEVVFSDFVGDIVDIYYGSKDGGLIGGHAEVWVDPTEINDPGEGDVLHAEVKRDFAFDFFGEVY